LKPKPEDKIKTSNFINVHGKKSVLNPTALDLQMQKQI